MGIYNLNQAIAVSNLGELKFMPIAERVDGSKLACSGGAQLALEPRARLGAILLNESEHPCLLSFGNPQNVICSIPGMSNHRWHWLKRLLFMSREVSYGSYTLQPAIFRGSIWATWDIPKGRTPSGQLIVTELS